MSEHEFCIWLIGYLAGISVLDSNHRIAIIEQLDKINHNINFVNHKTPKLFDQFSPYAPPCNFK